jgi:hypothetical protein
MNEFAGAVTRFADDLEEIGVPIAARQRGMDLYLRALLAPSAARWRSFYRFVFEMLAEQRQLPGSVFNSGAIGRLVALIEDDFGERLFGAARANALQRRLPKHGFHEASVPS